MERPKASVLQSKEFKILFLVVVGVVVGILASVFIGEAVGNDLPKEGARRQVYILGFAALIAALAVVWLSEAMRGPRERPAGRPRWFFPLMAGLLTLVGMILVYTLLGMWPLGDKTALIVDMYHQYAPFMAKLRDILLNGGSPLYTFEAGLGINFLSMFAYYIASPLNFLLVFFPKDLLPEGILFITLPSGRRLAYVKPRMGENRFGSECVTYEGTGVARKWERIESSPGKWVENITQAVARDILYHAMSTLRRCDIVMHCHDEVVLEADRRMSIEAVCEQMSRTPSWAIGLPLRAEGFECDFYQKG